MALNACDSEVFPVRAMSYEFHLAAIVQNLKTLALRALGPPTAPSPASLA